MKPLLDRIVLAVTGLSSLYVGIYAYFATATWYENFPGFGLRWLPQLGPFNEHLAKDVGAAYLAFAVLSLVTLVRVRDQVVVRMVGASLLVFNLLHLVYHLAMLHMYEPRDQVLNVLVLGLSVVLPVVLVVPSRTRSRGDLG